jgi:hypothetical protein
MVGTAQERLCPPYGLLEVFPAKRFVIAAKVVGWAKPPGANASGGVPTIQPPIRTTMVGTAQQRLCPPYGLLEVFPAKRFVIPAKAVGRAKPPGANASGGVPTIQPPIRTTMVGTAQQRLCPPYGLLEVY